MARVSTPRAAGVFLNSGDGTSALPPSHAPSRMRLRATSDGSHRWTRKVISSGFTMAASSAANSSADIGVCPRARCSSDRSTNCRRRLAISGVFRTKSRNSGVPGSTRRALVCPVLPPPPPAAAPSCAAAAGSCCCVNSHVSSDAVAFASRGARFAPFPWRLLMARCEGVHLVSKRLTAMASLCSGSKPTAFSSRSMSLACSTSSRPAASLLVGDAGAEESSPAPQPAVPAGIANMHTNRRIAAPVTASLGVVGDAAAPPGSASGAGAIDSRWRRTVAAMLPTVT
mmetsp:Transcript_4109/g.13059  ORF Transcript_4109/g.13059 Transcript_4109/m.13059 type:complete len:285 (+) Transcript_4109:1756-2610(+)